MAKRSSRGLALLAILVLTTAAARPTLRKDWQLLTSDNFTILSEAGERKTREVAVTLERFRHVLAQIRPDLPPREPVPAQVFLFASERAYRAYKPPAMENEGVAGQFYGDRFGSFIALNAFPAQGSALPVVFHEYVHYFLANHFGSKEVWLQEGLAEFYRPFEVDGGDARIGRPLLEHITWLRQNSFLPLTRLLAMGPEAPEYRGGGDLRRTVYAQSWLLIHYLLLELPGGADRANRFLALAQTKPVEEAVKEAFGTDCAGLESRLRRYVNSPTLPVQRLPVASPSASTAKLEPLGQAHVLAGLAAMLAAMGPDRTAEAESHALAALEIQPDNGDAMVALATVRAAQSKELESAGLFDRASNSPLRTPRAQAMLGEALLRRAGNLPAPGSRETVATARRILQQALELHPSFAEAAALVGMSYLLDSAELPTPEALALMEKASVALPNRVDLAENLKSLKTRLAPPPPALPVEIEAGAEAGAENTPRASVRVVIESPEPETIRRFYDLVDAANKAQTAGKIDDALRHLRAALAIAWDQENRAAVAAHIKKLEQRHRRTPAAPPG